eukprot:6315873-Amphidinium_carterae.1
MLEALYSKAFVPSNDIAFIESSTTLGNSAKQTEGETDSSQPQHRELGSVASLLILVTVSSIMIGVPGWEGTN